MRLNMPSLWDVGCSVPRVAGTFTPTRFDQSGATRSVGHSPFSRTMLTWETRHNATGSSSRLELKTLRVIAVGLPGSKDTCVGAGEVGSN
jgi:hypothetical protein